MATRRPTPEQQAAMSRRLALLGVELSGVRPARPGAAGARAGRVEEEEEEPPWFADAEVSAMREPGRHAARRRRSGVTERLGDSSVPALAALSGLSGLRAAHLAVVSVVVTLGLIVTCWWLVKGDAEPVETLSATPAGSLVSAEPALSLEDAEDDGSFAAGPAVTGQAATGQAATGGTSAPATVTVDVAGKVRRPGIAVLDAGARVVDAIAAAGGAKQGVDLAALNLARVLVDGEQVLVGAAPAPGVAAASATAAASSGSAQATLVDLNSATQEQLDGLPEVGPVTAASIIAWRSEHGGFTSVDELLEVDGIGEVTLGRIAPFVTL